MIDKSIYIEFTKQLKDLVIKSKSIGICVHINPDGDALGSMLGLYGALKQLNDNVICIKSDDTPKYLSFLPGIGKIVPYSENMEFDLLITLDSSSADRIGTCQSILKDCKYSINIDHHISNENFADLNFVVSDASSTSEIVYNIIKELPIDISKEMASSIYVGILTDTNRFLYKNASASTLYNTAELINIGIDKDYIHYMLYQVNTKTSFCLTGEIIKNTKFYHNEKLAICVVDSGMLDCCGANLEDTEDKINMLRDIECVEVACLIKEESNKNYKVSLRSKRVVDVSKICESFNGGGHVHAGGFSYIGDVDSLIKDLLEVFNGIKWDEI